MENFDLGTYLKEVREGLGLTMQAVEDRSKQYGSVQSIGASHLSRIETNLTHPGFKKLQGIAAALGIPLITIFEGEQAAPNTVTILSTQDLAEALIEALKRPEVLTLLTYFLQLNKEQQNAMLELFRSFENFKRLLNQSSEIKQEIPQEGE